MDGIDDFLLRWFMEVRASRPLDAYDKAHGFIHVRVVSEGIVLGGVEISRLDQADGEVVPEPGRWRIMRGRRRRTPETEVHRGLNENNDKWSRQLWT